MSPAAGTTALELAHPMSIPVGWGLGLSLLGLLIVLLLIWRMVYRRRADNTALAVLGAIVFTASITLRVGHYLGWWA